MTETKMHTPWGYPQDIEELDKGIWRVYTASHGGLKLSRERWDELPDLVRDSFITPAFAEEDLEEPIAMTLLGLGNGRELEMALNVANCFPRYAPALPHLREIAPELYGQTPPGKGGTPRKQLSQDRKMKRFADEDDHDPRRLCRVQAADRSRRTRDADRIGGHHRRKDSLFSGKVLPSQMPSPQRCPTERARDRQNVQRRFARRRSMRNDQQEPVGAGPRSFPRPGTGKFSSRPEDQKGPSGGTGNGAEDRRALSQVRSRAAPSEKYGGADKAGSRAVLGEMTMLQGERARKEKSLGGRAVLEALRSNLSLLGELAARYEVAFQPERPEGMPVISSAQDVHNLLAPEMSTLAQEQLRVLLLDTRNNVLGQRVIYQGNVKSSVVRPAEVFRYAIIESAPNIIIVHNHPGGDPTPSPEDVSITQELAAAGKLLGINLMDHLVIGGNRFVSLKERGMMAA